MQNLQRRQKVPMVLSRGFKGKCIRLARAISGFCIVALVMFGCTYIILVVGANSSHLESQRWGKNLIISLIQDILISQIIKLFLTLYLLKVIGKRKRGKLTMKLMKFMIDPLATRALAIAFVKPTETDPNLKANSSRRKRHKEKSGSILGRSGVKVVKRESTFNFHQTNLLKARPSMARPSMSNILQNPAFIFRERDLTHQVDVPESEAEQPMNPTTEKIVEANEAASPEVRPRGVSLNAVGKKKEQTLHSNRAMSVQKLIDKDVPIPSDRNVDAPAKRSKDRVHCEVLDVFRRRVTAIVTNDLGNNPV